MLLLVASIKTGLQLKLAFNEKLSCTTPSTIATTQQLNNSDKKQVHLLQENNLYFSQIAKNLEPTGQKDTSNHGSTGYLTHLFPL